MLARNVVRRLKQHRHQRPKVSRLTYSTMRITAVSPLPTPSRWSSFPSQNTEHILMVFPLDPFRAPEEHKLGKNVAGESVSMWHSANYLRAGMRACGRNNGNWEM